MGIGIGPMELVILLIIGGIIVFKWSVYFARRPGSVGGDVNLPHPQLKQCPGCGAPITGSTDVCPQCGLRISA